MRSALFNGMLLLLIAGLSNSLSAQCGLCDSTDTQEQIAVFGSACYDCPNNTLNLTPTPDACGGAVYEVINIGDFSARLDLLNGFRLPLRVNFDEHDSGREGFVFVLATDRELIRPDGNNGYMGYRRIEGSLGFVFDIHPNVDADFNETLPFDEFRLVAYGMKDSIIRDSIPILSPVLNSYQNVETGQNRSILITYDSVLKLLEIHVDRYHRLTYNIDLFKFFGQQQFAFPGVVGCGGPDTTNIQIGIADNDVRFNTSFRDYTQCGAANRFLNWVHGSPADAAAWELSNDLQEITQRVEGLPVFLQTHFPLMEAEVSIDISILDSFPDRNNEMVLNTIRNSLGVAVGLRQPYAQYQENGSGILLDWMGQGSLSSGTNNSGIFLSELAEIRIPTRADNLTHALRSRSVDGRYQILDHSPGQLWEPGHTYNIQASILSDSIYLSIRDTMGDVLLYEHWLPTEAPSGRFALYNYGQPGVRYENFDYRLLHAFTVSRDSICPRDTVTFRYAKSKTRRLVEIAREAYWDFGDGTQQEALINGEIVSATHSYFRSGDKEVTLFVVDSSGCSHPFRQSVHILNGPLIQFGNDTTLCFGEELFLFPGETSDDLLWQDGTESPGYSVTQPDEYVATSIGAGRCTVSDTINVYYRDSISYELTLQPDCPATEEGSIRVLPGIANQPLLASLNGENGLEHENLIAGTYRLSVSNTTGCTLPDSLIFIPQGINSSPPTTIMPASCEGSLDGSIRFTTPGEPIGVVFAGETILEDTLDFPGLASGAYIAQFIDTIGCTVIDTILVPIRDTFRLLGLQDTSILPGQDANLSAMLRFGLPDSVSWRTGDGDILGNDLELTVSPTTSTTYIVEVVSQAGCRSSSIVNVLVDDSKQLYVPTAFSPNFDGYNDYLYPMGGRVSSSVASIMSFEVFSRNGGMAFSRYDFSPDDPAMGWDGKTRNKTKEHLPQLFIYQLVWLRLDGETIVQTGEIYLMR